MLNLRAGIHGISIIILAPKPNQLRLVLSILAACILLSFTANSFALTTVVDLSGKWSGTVSMYDVDGYCSYVGNVSATLTQDGNSLSGQYSFSITDSKPTGKLEGLESCSYDMPFSGGSVSGNVDGTFVILTDSAQGLELTGSATSDLLTLNFGDQYVIGTVKLQKYADFGKPSPPKSGSAQTANELVQTGLSYLSEKRFDKALESFSKIIGQDPKNVMGWMGKGVSYVGLKNYDQAITHFKKVLDLSPNNKDALHWLGIAYFYKGDCKTSANYYSLALKIDPQNSKMLSEKKTVDACLTKTTQKQEQKTKAADTKKADDTKKKDTKETQSKFVEPPSPIVYKTTEQTKPFFKALWDGKCDILSKQWELITTRSERLPIVCTGGTIALKSGEIIRFNVGKDWEVKLLKWGGEGLAVNYVSTAIPPVGALLKVFETATSPIETIKALNLVITKGKVELLGGTIDISVGCGTGNCKLFKTEEEGGGFKITEILAIFDPKTGVLNAKIPHNSVYILVEYAKTQEKTQSLLYENKQYGFSMRYPSSWQMEELSQKAPSSDFVPIVKFTPSKETVCGIGFSENNSDYKGLGEKQFLAKMKKQVSDMCSAAASSGVGCSEITTSADTHKNGYKMYSIYYAVAVPSEKGTATMIEATTYIPDGNDIWSLQVFSTSPSDLENIGQELGSSLDSFKIYDYTAAKSKVSQKQATKAPKTMPPAVKSDAGTLQLNSDQFSISKYSKTEIIVSGQVSNYQQGVPLTLKIIKPDSTVEEQRAMVTHDGNYKSPLRVGSDWPAGTYTITAIYGSQAIGSVSFRIITVN